MMSTFFHWQQTQAKKLDVFAKLNGLFAKPFYVLGGCNTGTLHIHRTAATFRNHFDQLFPSDIIF